MKQFEFSHENKCWDEYHAFHTTKGPFVEFETGELMVKHRPEPYERKYYDKYDITLATTADADCPTLYLDKECTVKVPKAWVNQGGQQHLAIDHQQKVAVRVDRRWFRDGKKNLQFLSRQHQWACALWNSSDALPVPINSISLSKPDREFAQRTKQKVAEVDAVVTAAGRIHGVAKHCWTREKAQFLRAWENLSVDEIVKHVCDNPVGWELATANGFMHPRVQEQAEFLFVK